MIGKSRKVKNDDNQAVTIDDSLIIVKDEKQKKAKKKFSIKIFAIISLLILLFLTLLFALRFLSFNATDMLWKVSVTRGSDTINNKSIKYQSFKNGMFRISNDGITYISDKGKINYAISYNMVDPIYEVSENYFAIANRNASEFYIFDNKGLLGKNNSSFPIQKISLSDEGVLYILEGDEKSSYINLYRKNGDRIDISIKNVITGDGMPIDICVSPDGTELIVDYACLDNNNIFSKATFYNFDEVGKTANSKRIVGEFIEEFKDKFLARVHFFNNENSFLLYDDGVYYVSTSVKTSPVIKYNATFEKHIKSISYNSKYLVIVFEDNQMIVQSVNGETIADKKLDFEYDNFYISDNYIIFLYGSRAMIYDTKGRLIFDKELSSSVQYIAKKKSLFFTELLLGLIDGVECIRFY